MIVCCTCKIRKPYEEFHKASRRKSGYRSECKACVRRYRQSHYAANKEYYKAYMYDYYRTNKADYDNNARRYRARKHLAKSIEYTPEQLDQRMSMFGYKCYLCGGVFENVEHVKPLFRGGLDCLSNLRPACKSCNSSKGAIWPYPPVYERYKDYELQC